MPGVQALGRLAKRAHHLLDSLLDRCDHPLEALHHVQMLPQQKAVVVGDEAIKGLLELRPLVAGLSLGKVSQLLGILLTIDHRSRIALPLPVKSPLRTERSLMFAPCSSLSMR
jgi:hypothetical protein